MIKDSPRQGSRHHFWDSQRPSTWWSPSSWRHRWSCLMQSTSHPKLQIQIDPLLECSPCMLWLPDPRRPQSPSVQRECININVQTTWNALVQVRIRTNVLAQSWNKFLLGIRTQWKPSLSRWTIGPLRVCSAHRFQTLLGLEDLWILLTSWHRKSGCGITSLEDYSSHGHSQ